MTERSAEEEKELVVLIVGLNTLQLRPFSVFSDPAIQCFGVKHGVVCFHTLCLLRLWAVGDDNQSFWKLGRGPRAV